MRAKLANDLESRDGTVSRDAGLRNAFIEKEGEWSSGVIKRPGTIPSTLNYSGFQGFSPLSFTDLPYGQWPNISDLLFTINLDGWGLGTLLGAWDPSPPPPGFSDWDNIGPVLPIEIPSGSYTYSAQIIRFGGVYYAWDMGNGHDPFPSMYTSPDLINWTTIDLTSDPNRASGPCVEFGGRIHVYDSINGDGSIYSFSNGSDWSNTVYFSEIATSLSQFIKLGPVVFGLCRVPAAGIWYSTDMVNWTQAYTNLPTASGSRFRFVSFLGKLWAFPDSGSAQVAVYSSADGVNWTQETADWGLGTLSYGSLVVGGDYLYYVGGAVWAPAAAVVEGIRRSSDGITWELLDSNVPYPGKHSPVALFNGTHIISAGGGDLLGGSLKEVIKAPV